jgi:hypothetical protein
MAETENDNKDNKEEKKAEYVPRTSGIDFDGMFDPNKSLFGNEPGDLATDQLASIASDEKEQLRQLELRQIEENRAAIASRRGGKGTRATGGRSSMSFRDPVLEAEKKNKKNEYEVTSFETKMKKAELDKMKIDAEIARERRMQGAREEAELAGMSGKKAQQQPAAPINPEAIITMLNASKKPDGSVDPMIFSTLTGSLTGGGNAPDMSNILLMQLLGGNQQQQQVQKPGMDNQILVMLVIEMIKQMNQASQANMRNMSEMYKSQPRGGGGGGGGENSNMLNIAMQMAQNNSQQQQGMFQLMLEKMKDENSELRQSLSGQDPLGEISRTAAALKNLGVFGQSFSPEVQLKIKEMDHLHEIERVKMDNDQQSQASFANTFESLGKEVVQSEWLGGVLSSLGDIAKTGAQERIERQQHQQQQPAIMPQDLVDNFQYSQPAPPPQQQQPPPQQYQQQPPINAPGSGPDESEFNALLSQLQAEMINQGQIPQQPQQPQPQQQQPYNENENNSDSINLDNMRYKEDTEDGVPILDLSKIMSPKFGVNSGLTREERRD